MFYCPSFSFSLSHFFQHFCGAEDLLQTHYQTWLTSPKGKKRRTSLHNFNFFLKPVLPGTLSCTHPSSHCITSLLYLMIVSRKQQNSTDFPAISQTSGFQTFPGSEEEAPQELLQVAEKGQKRTGSSAGALLSAVTFYVVCVTSASLKEMLLLLTGSLESLPLDRLGFQSQKTSSKQGHILFPETMLP